MELTTNQFLFLVILLGAAFVLPVWDKQTLSRIILYASTGLGIFMLLSMPGNSWGAVMAGGGIVFLAINEWINS